MNTLDDLRASLATHTPREDEGLHGRADAVRSRVQAVRRRRRVSTVVGAVAAVALIATGIAVPRLLAGPAEPDLAAPTTVTVGGFEYRLARIVETEPGQDALDVHVPGGADQVVALLAEDLGDGWATLWPDREDANTTTWDGIPADRIMHDGANPPLPLASSGVMAEDGRYTLAVQGGTSRTRVGVAVYERTEAMPDGVVDPTGHTVFRRHADGRTLLAATFVEPGASEATVTFTGRLSDVRISDFCSVPGDGAAGSRPWVHVSIEGHGLSGGFSSGECGEPSESAPGGGTSFPDSHETGTFTARVWTSPGQAGTDAPVEGAVAGVGIYGAAETVQVHGSTVDRVVEFAGRLWQLDRTIESKPGAHRVRASWDTLDDHLLAGYAVEGTRRVTLGGSSIQGSTNVDGTSDSLAESRSSGVAGIVVPGHAATAMVSWPARDSGASGAILLYRPVDQR